MSYSAEIDWVAAWYENYGVWDTTISFWMLGTFAVIIATHALGNRVTPQLSRLLVSLYGAFSLYTLIRMYSIGLEGLYILDQLQMFGVNILPAAVFTSPAFFSDIVIWLIITIGTLATAHFIWTAPRRNA